MVDRNQHEPLGFAGSCHARGSNLVQECWAGEGLEGGGRHQVGEGLEIGEMSQSNIGREAAASLGRRERGTGAGGLGHQCQQGCCGDGGGCGSGSGR